MGLALRLQFLQGTYQAAEPGRITEPEWPPHPVRVHCALLAGGWAGAGGDAPQGAALAALKWLEQAGAPTIALPLDASRRSSPMVYVPRNPTSQEVSDARGSLRRANLKAFRRQFDRVDRTFPTMVVGDQPMWLAWPDSEPESEIRSGLEALAGYVSYLGSSRSPVGCSVADAKDAPEPTLVPVDGTGTYVLRVAGVGLTDELIASRYEFGGVGGTAQPYRHAGRLTRDGSADELPVPGPFGRMLTLQRSDGFQLTLAHTAIVARALRNAVLANAGDEAPAVLHGHGRNPHVAFLPLASVGNRYAGGEIRGFAVAIPTDVTAEEEAAILAAVHKIEKVAITRDIVPWRVEHVPDPASLTEPGPDSPPRTLDPVRWIGPATSWATVTPVVLDRHTRPGRPQSAEDMVRLAFANALLPEPSEVELSRAPFLGGAVPVGVHTANGAPRGALWHVRAHFDRPVRGPVLAGRGRYLGTGLFAPLPERRRGGGR